MPIRAAIFFCLCAASISAAVVAKTKSFGCAAITSVRTVSIICRVRLAAWLSLDVRGIDEDREKFGAKVTLHAREVCLSGLVGSRDIVAIHGTGGDIVVCVDEDSLARNTVDLCLVTGLAGGVSVWA